MGTTVRVLQVIKGLDIGGWNGGSENFGINLSCQLRADGCEVTLCAFYHYHTQVEQEWCEQLEKLGIKVVFANPNSHTRLFMILRHLNAVCREQKIDLIHSHHQIGTLIALMLKMTGSVRRVVRTAHITQEWGTGLIPWIMRQLFTKWLYPMALDAEVGVSDAIVENLKCHPGARLMNRNPFRIYNAIDASWFEEIETVDRKNRREDDLFVIGSVGRLIDRKGYGFLLKAFAAVAKTYPNIKLVLVGDGEGRAKLEVQSSALGIQKQVSFLGQRSDVRDILKSFNLFVLPSLQEGLPTVLLESMACGVPVIATDIPGTQELVEDGINGWLVAPGDSDALTLKIQQGIQSPGELERLKMAAIRTVRAYSFQEAAKQYENLYECLLIELRGERT